MPPSKAPPLNRRDLVIGLAGLSIPARAYGAAAVNVRDFGAVGNGEADDTAALQAAHALGRPVWYPRPASFYRISRTIAITGDVSGDRAAIRCRQDGSHGTSIFRVVDNRRPIVIRGLVMDGGYETGSAGEWSAAIELIGASHVTIVDNDLRRPYGDCVYLGTFDRRQGCSDIRIERNRLVDPRRCCVAVICAERVQIVGNRIEKHAGYVSAIDLEPNPNGFDHVRDVTIRSNFVNVRSTFVTVDLSASHMPAGQVSVRNNWGVARRLIASGPPQQVRNVRAVTNIVASPPR